MVEKVTRTSKQQHEIKLLAVKMHNSSYHITRLKSVGNKTKNKCMKEFQLKCVPSSSDTAKIIIQIVHETLFSRFQTPYNIIIINLACAEFVMATIGVTIDVVMLIQNCWKYGKFLCVSTEVIVTTCGFVSILTIYTISICRYESILQFDKSYEEVTSHKKSLQIISFIWIVRLTFFQLPQNSRKISYKQNNP